MKELTAFTMPSPLPGSGGWGNGYVAIPEGHPCFGLDYDQIYDKYTIDVHGGLTYSETAHEKHPDEVQGMWIVGFDTLHLYDSKVTWPDEASVMREAEKLKDQLQKIGEGQLA